MIKFGDKVFLDTFTEYDSNLMRNWRNQFSIWRWCRQNDLIPEGNHKAWFEKLGKDPTIRMYAIRGFGPFTFQNSPSWRADKDEMDRLVGVCGLTSIDMLNRHAEFSVYVAPEFQKMGFAREALKSLVSHGFLNLGLNCIWGETFEGNHAAKLFEKLGFKYEGSRRDFYFKEGVHINAKLYSILHREWLENENFPKVQK